MRTVIVVPYRSDGGRRDELWRFTRTWLERHHPHCDIHVGASPAGPFNRSAAINAAARRAGDWDVAMVCDSDTVVPPDQFEKAAAMAMETGLLASALTTVAEVRRAATDQLLAAADVDVDLHRLGTVRTRRKDDLTQSSVIAVPRSLWESVGGFDEGFSGWGCEDNAFWLAATLFCGEPLRVPGSAFHLWHPSASKVKLFDPVFRTNFRRLRHYKRATTPGQLTSLLRA